MTKELTRIPQDFEGFQSFTKAHDFPIFIFGADIVGKVIAELLKSHGITVNAFVDNNKNKCNINIGNIKVIHASELAKEHKDSIILIASTYIADIIAQLEDMGFLNWLPIYNILEDKKNTDLESLLVGDLRYNHSGGGFTQDFDSFVLSNMINSQKKYLDPESLYIRSVDLILTEKCSLKCKDCSNLMQYYEKPVNISLEELYQDLDDLCAVADEINEIRIIGGDPFMHKECHKVVQHAASFEQVNKVVIYTNGTICPPEEKIAQMAHEKTFVFITTYGNLSRNAEKLGAALKKYNIPFNIQDAYGWTDCGDIKLYDRDQQQLNELFRFCCAKNFTTLTDGKMYRCPFAANTDRLKAMPESADNYVSLKGLSSQSAEHIQQKKLSLKHYLRDISNIPACNSCNGRTYGDPEIQPGIQVEQRIQYKEYARIIEKKPI